MTRKAHPKAATDGGDRVLERLVVKRTDLTAALVDDVMVVALGVGNLIPGDPIAPVQAMQQPKLEQLVKHPVDRGRRGRPLPAKQICDLLRAHQALPLTREQLDHRRARRSRSQPGTIQPPLRTLKPAITEARVHTPRLPYMRASPIYGSRRGGTTTAPLWPDRSGAQRECAVIVAMPAVRVMEMLADEIVDVIAMGNLLVTAIGAMNMRGLMPTADVLRRAIRRVGAAHPQDMLVDVIAVGVMQMPVMQIVDVALVLDRRVPTIGSMRVGVPCVDAVLRISHDHDHSLGHIDRQIDGDEKHSHTCAPSFSTDASCRAENRLPHAPADVASRVGRRRTCWCSQSRRRSGRRRR
jgi:hypothetical protein